ncbi:MAG: cupin domain-containing protein, partial [Thermoplasmata archaeon]
SPSHFSRKVRLISLLAFLHSVHMADRYTISDIASAIEFAEDGIVSKTILDTPESKVVLFCMAGGQSLSEHTASMPATIHFLGGSGKVRLGEDEHPVKEGVWVHMPAGQLHAIDAEADLVFLLTLFR